MCNGSALTQGMPRIVDNAGRGIMPVGIESFVDVLRRFVYVDKTLVVRDLVDGGGVTLFCRPRRFGKSTTMRMLRAFFELSVEGFVPDNRGLFENLAIWDEDERYRAECGAHPVIYLSLGGCGRGSYEDTLAGIAQQMADEVVRHRYLLESPKLMGFEKARLERVAACEASAQELRSSLKQLSELLRRHHGGRQTVILIDEYDTPVNDGYINGYRREILDFYRIWLTDALKGTDALYCAALTGVLRVSQESIFSELNNVVVNTSLDEEFGEAFGFTRDEARALAAHVGMDDRFDEMTRWYDGYHMGGSEVFNPWSVIRYLRAGVAQPYWTNTSSNGIVRDLIAHADDEATVELATLSSGGTVAKPLDLRTVFDDLSVNPEAVWPQLYQAGYVTTRDTGVPNDDEMLRRLRVPNLEVVRLFNKELTDRSVVMAGTRERLDALHRALVAGDSEAFAHLMRRVLLDSPSYHDLLAERDYHVLLLGLLYAVPGYRPATSNRESGDGRCDVLLEPLPGNAPNLPAIAMEVKFVSPGGGVDASDEELARVAREDALAQAVRLGYGHGLAGTGLLRWGIAFSGKRVAVAHG